MKQEFTFPSKDGATQIYATEWKPEGEIRAVLQISHGMDEFIDRYDRYARFLNEHGFLVVGNDHLGHGRSVRSDEFLGYFGNPHGNECLIADLHTLREMKQQEYAGVPYFMLGHSMGSFLIRQYMEMHGEGLAGVVVMGTGSQSKGTLTAAKTIAKVIKTFHGWKYRSKFLDGLAAGSYNKKFEPARTDHDWLTKDTDIVDWYLQQPWCTFTFTVNGYYQMFRGIEYIQAPEHIARIPKDLPVYLVSGEEDPVGNFGKGVQEVYDALKAAGIRDLEMKLYPGDRHEILNELDYQDVYAEQLAWMEARMG